MLSLSPEILSLLAATGFLAGTIDAIAGGGGLLTLPVLLSAGLPPHIALGTNKFQSMCGTAVAAWRYARAGLIDWRNIMPAVIGTFLGAALGTFSVQQINPDILKPLVPFLLMAMAVYFLFSKRLSDADSHVRMSMPMFAISFAAVIGFYDGFFGPGTGSFFAASMIGFLGMNIKRATANTKVLNLTSNLAALLMFLLAGQILWQAALVMAAAQVFGGALGARLAITHGARLIRPVLVCVSLALCLKLLWG